MRFTWSIAMPPFERNARTSDSHRCPSVPVAIAVPIKERDVYVFMTLCTMPWARKAFAYLVVLPALLTILAR